MYMQHLLVFFSSEWATLNKSSYRFILSTLLGSLCELVKCIFGLKFYNYMPIYTASEMNDGYTGVLKICSCEAYLYVAA